MKKMNTLITTSKVNMQAKQYGFTMVELMIAVVLALLLALIAGQSYLSTKTTYRATEQNARVQENLRFATHFIKKELRQAGNLGCFQKVTSHLFNPNDEQGVETIEALYDLSQPVNAWRYRPDSGNAREYNLGDGDAYRTPNGERGKWRDWQNRSNGNGNRRRPTREALNGQVMTGNDILLVTKISEPLGIRLNENLLNSNVLSVASFNGTTIPTGQVMLVGNCNQADLFVHTGAQTGGGAGGGSLTRGNGGSLEVTNRTAGTAVWSRNWGSNAEVRLVESTLYFIGQGSSGLPALFKLDLGNGLGTATAATQPLEIVDGIESMKVIVGLDTDSDGTFDRYRLINQIANPTTGTRDIRDVRTVQVGLLASGDSNSGIADASQVQFRLTQRHVITSPADDRINPAILDTRYRQAATTTVQLRNAGLSRVPQVIN